jgi:hypothetical protein
MKYLEIYEIHKEINEVLLKRKLIKHPIDFNNMTFAESIEEIIGHCRILEYKSYYKNYKRPIKDLRYLYLMVEKWIQHEKRYLLNLRKKLDELTCYDDTNDEEYYDQ